ncbi:PREDICTED: uncharacterized protein LOC105364965 [Ceratosolen solmsi marchali]|uniref:Uncharacterized protein LOC105364965 n=1 Tax=Ceratosolen solmsi marchali TaxID=326594 RepID=A0AAJ7DYQ7_9HYME|nr:PREDICTED: uncharacterized protein LOC105364965 [Ceratosolen solmsi marchali]
MENLPSEENCLTRIDDLNNKIQSNSQEFENVEFPIQSDEMNDHRLFDISTNPNEVHMNYELPLTYEQEEVCERKVQETESSNNAYKLMSLDDSYLFLKQPLSSVDINNSFSHFNMNNNYMEDPFLRLNELTSDFKDDKFSSFCHSDVTARLCNTPANIHTFYNTSPETIDLL